ncbi:MAG: DUF3841 domain-containing protein [Eubacterium sp.]|jgi:hypothetical protein|uniref:DUF3841 domain-containing protein n=1 Tax=Eubacterium sp. F2 TaxID=3381348 RepID=UPI00390818E7|nr:DUF3841 domain-containing protein [Eubacterium sp.]MCI2197776.1 DUF3841 domain-containing protein [Eubacterium sp.]
MITSERLKQLVDRPVVRLYTRQNDKTLEQLRRDGRIINQRLYVQLHLGDIAPLFLESYDWLTERVAKIVPKPDDVHAPIWCSVCRENCLKPIEGTVVYVIDVPREKICLFDDGKWDYVLNRIYLPKDEADDQAYHQHLRDLGVESRFQIMQGKYAGMFPEEERRIRESWERIFDIDDWSPFHVCGNIWEIRDNQVKQILRPEDPQILI